jgi:hypothetical protein
MGVSPNPMGGSVDVMEDQGATASEWPDDDA